LTYVNNICNLVAIARVIYTLKFIQKKNPWADPQGFTEEKKLMKTNSNAAYVSAFIDRPIYPEQTGCPYP
jgi:hypothetical protein